MIAAIADPNEEMRNMAGQMAPEATCFDDYRAMLKEVDCDAYVIVTPNDTHHDVLQDVLPLGKPVLCEKPLCTTTQDCRDVIAMATAPVWVAMEYRYMDPLQHLQSRLHTVGTPQMVAIREHRFPFLPKVNDWNRFSDRTGGTLVEKCCHFWDLMRLMLQRDPVRVYASGAMDVNHQGEQYGGRSADMIDNAFVVVEFEGGARGMLDLCMFAEGSKWQEVISVTGPKARVDACVPGPARFSKDGREQMSQIVLSDRAAKQERIEPVEVDEEILKAGDHHGSSFFQHQRFLKLVRGDIKTPEVSLEDGLWSVRIGEAAEQSAATGQAVDLQKI